MGSTHCKLGTGLFYFCNALIVQTLEASFQGSASAQVQNCCRELCNDNVLR